MAANETPEETSLNDLAGHGADAKPAIEENSLQDLSRGEAGPAPKQLSDRERDMLAFTYLKWVSIFLAIYIILATFYFQKSDTTMPLSIIKDGALPIVTLLLGFIFGVRGPK